MSGIEIYPAQRDRLLREACDRNVPARVRPPPAGGRPLVYKTRFLGQREEEAPVRGVLLGRGPRGVRRWLVIDRPALGSDPHALGLGVSVVVTFSMGGQFLRFGSETTRFVEVGGEVRAVLSGIEMAYPELVEHVQEREYFRVDPGLREQVTVMVRRVAFVRTSEGPAEAAAAGLPEARPCELYCGLLVNISEGGMAVRVDEPDEGVNLIADDDVVVVFQLPTDERDVTLGGVVRSRRVQEPRTPEERTTIVLGIEFNRGRGVNHATAIVHGYVMKRQRDSLKMRKER
ncbi:MAG: PilZ domain-containing protein [Planctomycetes bacterium]|nr:PilZ domain-containing protein [Planctomycetota bacterium]